MILHSQDGASPVMDFPEYELAGIETIARGVCIQNGKVLLCRAKGAPPPTFPADTSSSAKRAVRRSCAR